jgi:(1->4)-alpha-D-glucan 1-alpha-D-glucosylmutase
MRIPISTYRIQFNAQFGFIEAQAIASYLKDLGISDLYASPIFKARAGSMHGYDVVDFNQLNPELGSSEAFESLVCELENQGIGWLQDIVPNHMAYDSQNHYLMDVLEYGSDSDYASYFDLSWNSLFENHHDRILAPLLENFYGRVLEKGEIQLQYEQNGLSVNYFSLKLPLKPESYHRFLTHNLGQVTRVLGRNHPDFIKLLGVLYLFKTIPSEVTGKQQKDQVAFAKSLLWELYTSNETVQNFIHENLKAFNGEIGNPDSFNLLDSLLNEQFYRLAYWKVGAEEMNYRRFFTVNELISVKVEELKVFNQTHDLVFKLVEDGKFTGLRIDHIDGLYNPVQYLERLRDKVGDAYITVEKILELEETLPTHWPVQGTSGYDFLNYVNSIFCQSSNQQRFSQIYQIFTESPQSYLKLVKANKRLIIDRSLSGDIDNLADLLKKIARKSRYGNDFTLNGLRRAIAEVLTLFPLYRTYISDAGISDSDRQCIQAVMTTAKDHLPFLLNELIFIEKLLLLQFDESLTQSEQDQWLYFVMRLQQYTGPLMAKGVEDTTLYVYNRLLSLNEVGGDPSHFGLSVEKFHTFNQRHLVSWPHTMNATATHDTKRGEDVRARLNVLSEIPDQWAQQVTQWRELNQAFKQSRREETWPAPNDEYLFYQTLVGAFPFTESERESFVERVKEYFIKAIREAKVHSDWLRSNTDYEQASTHFAQAVLDPQNSTFWQQFLPFQQEVAYYGLFNSLSQTLLKIAAPGVPDFYQGTELWDLSLVDPDNRRPVDFELRRSLLQAIQESMQVNILGLMADLLVHKSDGRIKLFLIQQALRARRNNINLFQQGDYSPLTVQGKYKDHIVAFARRYQQQMAIAIAPRFLTHLIQPGENPLGEAVWQDTQLLLPDVPASHWTNRLTQQPVHVDSTLKLSEVLQHFPVALLVNERNF